MSGMRTVSILASAAIASAGMLFVLAAPALAHDELVGSSPASGADLHRLPTTVTLFFEEPPAAGFRKMSVVDPTGVAINSTGPVIDGSRISEPINSSGKQGSYSIEYRILSDDGHPVSGVIRFTLGAASTAAVARQATTTPATSSEASTTLWIAVGAGAALCAVLALAARTRSAPRPSASPEPGAV